MNTTEAQNDQLATISSNRYESINRVTMLSKYLALTLFIALPFIGGYVGYQLSPSTHISMLYESPSNVVVPVEIPTPTTAATSDAYTSWSLQQSFQIPLSGDTNLTGMLEFSATGKATEANINTVMNEIAIDSTALTLYANKQKTPLLSVHEYSGSTSVRDFVSTLIMPDTTPSDNCTLETVTTQEGSIYYAFIGTFGDATCPLRTQIVLLENYVVVIWYTPVDAEYVRIDPTRLSLESATMLQ